MERFTIYRVTFDYTDRMGNVRVAHMSMEGMNKADSINKCKRCATRSRRYDNPRNFRIEGED